MSESDQDFEKGWDECQEPSPGAFGDFFLDDELRETISPFLDITIEAEKIMLREICDSDSDSDYSSDGKVATSSTLIASQIQNLIRWVPSILWERGVNGCYESTRTPSFSLTWMLSFSLLLVRVSRSETVT